MPVVDGPRPLPDRALARQDAAEHLHDQPERRALVRAGRQEPGARRPVEALRVGHGPAGGVDRPAVRQGLLAVPLHADLPLGDDARRHVHGDRDAAARARNRHREGIRGQAPARAPVGDDRRGGRRVGPDEPDEPPLGGELHVIRQAADVVRAPHADGREALARGLLKGHIRGAARDDLPQAEVPVDDRGGGSLVEHLDRRPGVRVPLPDGAHVLRHPDHAMRVVAAEIGAHEEPGDPGGVAVGHPESGEDAGRERFQLVRGVRLHVGASWSVDGRDGSRCPPAPKRRSGYHEPPGGPVGPPARAGGASGCAAP